MEAKENRVYHPSHYNQYPIETIDMMVKIWGVEKVMDFCLLNAFKYRMRVGLKENIEEDLAKEAWYLDMFRSLKRQWECEVGPKDF